jgi:hypothetical protein
MKITKLKLKEIIREELVILTENKELSKSEKRAYNNKRQLPTWYILIKMKKQKTAKRPFDWDANTGSAGLDFISKKKSWTEDQFHKIMPGWVPGADYQGLFDCYDRGDNIETVDQMWT